MPQRAPGRAAHRLGIGALLPKSLAEDATAHAITDGPGHGRIRVWLRVFHPATWKEMTSTERDGDNSDSLPAHLSVSGGSMPWAVVDGSGGLPSPTKRGQSNTGSSFEVYCLISHVMPDSPQTGRV